MRNGASCCAFYFGYYRIIVRKVCYNKREDLSVLRGLK